MAGPVAARLATAIAAGTSRAVPAVVPRAAAAPLTKRSSVARRPGTPGGRRGGRRPVRDQVTAGRMPTTMTLFQGPGVGTLFGLATVFMASMGFGNISGSIIGFFNSGAFGGGGAGNLAGAMATYAMNAPDGGWHVRGCAPCVRACDFRVKPDPAGLIAAAEALVRGIDHYMRTVGVNGKKMTLVRYLNNLLVGYVDKRKMPRFLKLRYILKAAAPVAVGPLRGSKLINEARVLALTYVWDVYINRYMDKYVPGLRNAHNITVLQQEIIDQHPAVLRAFLNGTDEDLAPIAGLVMRHMIHRFNGLPVPTVACMMCKVSCNTLPKSN